MIINILRNKIRPKGKLQKIVNPKPNGFICNFAVLCKENSMGIFDRLFKKKSANGFETEFPGITSPRSGESYVENGFINRQQYIEQVILPVMCGTDWVGLFNNVPEVFWPIDFIASRIAGADFVLKKVKDDTVVWQNGSGVGKYVNSILTRPNAFMSFREIVYQHFVYRFTTGNAYMRAAMAENLKDASKYMWCTNYWELPADKVQMETFDRNVRLFDIAMKEEVIDYYRLNYGTYGMMRIPTWQVWHDRDGMPKWSTTNDALKSESRLSAQSKPISNLIAVYEARNVIYVKRGGIGFLTNLKKDDTGNVALTDSEKKELLEEHFKNYGLKKGQYPYGFSNSPLSFVRTNLSISELQPFDETLYDAITIAAAFGIPSVLVPRKDQSTFSNQATAEKTVYSGTVIPLAKQFCKDFTSFLGLEEKGYYIDCDFSRVDCLQTGMKEAEEVKQKINDRCKSQFENGLITLNDWRAQIGESQIEDIELFSKLKFQMTDEELAILNKVISNTNPSNTKPVENGKDEEPSVQNEGE